MQKQTGFSLVEVLLAAGLGLFLLLGASEVYLAIKRSFLMQQALISIHENALAAIYFLNENIRMAGYRNCMNAPASEGGENFIEGYGRKLPKFLANRNIVLNSDVITIKRCLRQGAKSEWLAQTFYVAKTSYVNKVGSAINGLFQVIDGKPREIVSGINNMKIFYGVVTDNSGIEKYLNADQMDMQDWKQVRGVQVALLLSSEDPVLIKPEPFNFNGEILPKDKVLRKEWDTYISLRNMAYSRVDNVSNPKIEAAKGE